MSEYIRDLRDKALELGIPEPVFWDMDLGEAVRAVKAGAERLQREMQWQAELVYKHACLTELAVNRQLGGKNKWPEIEDVFPGIFDAEKLKAERELRKAQAWGEQFKAFARVWNEKMEKQNG